MADGLRARGWSREQARKAARDFVAMRAHEAPDQPHKLGSSQVEVIAALRAMPAASTVHVVVDEDEARRARNKRKAERRQRR